MADRPMRFRMTQWLDNSDEAMAQPNATILYGVQAKHPEWPSWRHCHVNGEPMVYPTREEASAAIAKLKAGRAAQTTGGANG